jgi:hypothetical protein
MRQPASRRIADGGTGPAPADVSSGLSRATCERGAQLEEPGQDGASTVAGEEQGEGHVTIRPDEVAE